MELKIINKELFCRVCGFIYENEPPWGDDNESPSHELCICCCCEFGYEDSNLVSIRNYRNNWIKNGSKWSGINFKPNNWSLEKQLKNIPSKYL